MVRYRKNRPARLSESALRRIVGECVAGVLEARAKAEYKDPRKAAARDMADRNREVRSRNSKSIWNNLKADGVSVGLMDPGHFDGSFAWRDYLNAAHKKYPGSDDRGAYAVKVLKSIIKGEPREFQTLEDVPPELLDPGNMAPRYRDRVDTLLRILHNNRLEYKELEDVPYDLSSFSQGGDIGKAIARDIEMLGNLDEF